MTTTMTFTDQQMRIVYAALHELDIRLSRGLANSELDKATVRALTQPSRIHESYITELRCGVMLRIGLNSL